MRYLRFILVCWLAIAVPTTAMASAINAEHCQRTQKTRTMIDMDHAQHMRHMQNLAEPMTLSHTNHQDKQADTSCTCGCSCFNQHCASSFFNLMVASATADFYNGAAVQAGVVDSRHLASAHLLELLRPPTLS